MRLRASALIIGALSAAVIVLGVLLATDGGTTTKVVQAAVLAKTGTHAKSFLWTQDAHSGTLVPAGSKGEYDLTLSGVHPNALYFVDRPGAEVGVIELGKLLGGLFDKPGSAPPNAAVNALVPQRGNHQFTMGVTLLKASYDKAHQTVRYHVRALPQGPASRQEHGRTDVVLPRTFSHTSVFIDNGYHTCGASITNLTNAAITERSWPNNLGKWSTDSWDPYPPGNGPAPNDGGAWSYSTDGGGSDGCHNWINLQYGGGTIQVSLTNPYSGSNTPNCDVNETDSNYQFKCGYYGYSTVGGNNMSVEFFICSDSPTYQSTVSPGDGKTYGGCDWMTDNSGGSGGVVWFN